MLKNNYKLFQFFKHLPLLVLILYSVVSIFFYHKINSKLPLVSHYDLSFRDRILVWCWLIPELVLFGLIVRELAARGYRHLMWLIIGVFTAVYSVQYMSLYMSNDLVTPLGLENLNSLDLVINKRSVRGLLRMSIITFVFYGLWIFALKKSTPLPKMPIKRFLFVSAISLFLISVQNSNFFRSSKTAAHIWGAPPAVAMADSVLTYLFPELKSDRRFLFKKYSDKFNYNETSAFPFKKDFVYKEPLPFELKKKVDKPNVIIIFTEGMSASMLEPYGGELSGLTPHINKIVRQAMVVDNYYNHTAATLRGLWGQLKSGYSENVSVKQDLWRDNDYLGSLPTIFNENGYQTIFYIAHPKDKMEVKMMKHLGFSEVYFEEKISQELFGRRPRKKNMTDTDFLTV